MISHLLTAIAQTLQSGLRDYLPKSSDSIAVGSGALVLPSKLPYIRLSVGKVNFPLKGQDKGTISPGLTQLLMVREFQQEFSVEIYDTSTARLETCSSLVFGILSTTSDALIQAYNQGQPNLPKTEYAATSFQTVHTLSQIQLLEGVALTPEKAQGFQLQGRAIGQITVTQDLPEGSTPIQSIPLRTHLKSD